MDDYLLSDQSPPDCMQLSDLDGFLTGVAIGPELVRPSEWLTVVWGGEEPEFESEEMVLAIVGTILDRFNQILCDVEKGVFQPILWKNPDGTLIGDDWAVGFRTAMSLRPGAWDPMLQSKQVAMALFPIFALTASDEELAEIGVDDVESFAFELAHVIPESVIDIARFWSERRT
ncbi:MAG TPA: YecA family protein [Caulobacteraceae bacterium]